MPVRRENYPVGRKDHKKREIPATFLHQKRLIYKKRNSLEG
jgi:hypothetical protein|uniref:Uncharacterized protein n=1 Tax=Sphingobacterium sp. (strain 21) TaxID=743722 RepID=F4C9G3_SPHS2